MTPDISAPPRSVSPTTTAPAAPVASSTWLLIGAVLLLPFLAYFGTARAIVAIWQRSDTYAHGFVILPICLWLIWQRRDDLRPLPLKPWWPALPLLAACGLAWLLAELGDVAVVSQYAFAATLALGAVAILGLPLGRAMAFPLFFILFGVPFGEVFTDPLINVTANFTVDALRATGIPVFREGNSFTIPSGSWSVVEACSGVRYLISSVTLGCVFAYLTYRTARRRALFVLAAIIVPIVANGMRAYLIVMIGHLSGMTMAVGVDHLVYGWVFFGIVMFLLFWIGSFWRQDQPVAESAAPPAPRTYAAPPKQFALAALAIALAIGIWPLYLNYLERGQHQAAAAIDLALAPAAGWTAAPALEDWRPTFPAAGAELHQAYAGTAGAVGVDLLYYRNPPEGTKLISSMNRLASSERGSWTERGATVRVENVGGRALELRETTVGRTGAKLLVWQWYWIDGATTVSGFKGKLMQVQQKLLHRRDDGAAIMLSARYDEQPDEARATLRAWMNANLPALESTLERNRRH